MNLSLKLIIYFFPLLTCQTKTYHATAYVDGSILIVLNTYSSSLKVVQNWIDGLPWWLSVEESANNVETQVRSLVGEDPTCCETAKPRCHSYRACALEPRSCNCWAHMLQLPKHKHPRACNLQQEEPLQWEACVPQQESPPLDATRENPLSNEDPAQPKINRTFKKISFKNWIHVSNSIN